MLGLLVLLGRVSVSLANGKCALLWKQSFESPKLDDHIKEVGVAFPSLPSLPGAPDCSGSSCGVLPEARAFDSTWADSSVDSTSKRAAYTEKLASIHFTPYNLLYGEQGDILSAIDRDSCVAYNFISNRNSLVDEADNQVLQLDYPAGCVGKECALAARVDLDAVVADMGSPPLEEATLQYKFKFQEGFNFVKGGKLPGLCGGLCDTGCQPTNGLSGWSARHMWKQCIPKEWEQAVPPTAADKKCSTKLIAYPYHVNKFLQCGDEYTLATADGAVQPVPGQWHTLTSYIKMNTAGSGSKKQSYKEDGVMKTWVDGQLVLEETNMLWRKYDNVTISSLFISTFFGGSDDTWASPQDQDGSVVMPFSGVLTPQGGVQYIRFDDFEVKQGLCPPEHVLDQSSENRYKYHKLEGATVGKGTSTIDTLYGLSEKACWKKCVDTAEGACKSAVHAKGRKPKTLCELLDSAAEHRLERIEKNSNKASLLYPAAHREMALPPLIFLAADGLSVLGVQPDQHRVAFYPHHHDTIRFKKGRKGYTAPEKRINLNPRSAHNPIDKSTPCSMLFGAPLGTFSWPSAGELGRKQKCGGDKAWAAKNPPSPATTCKGFLHCHFVDAKVSLCERTRDLVTGPLDICNRVGEGVQCGGDEAFMKKAKTKGGICCEDTLDCVYEKPTMSRCVKIPELSEADNPFGEIVRPRTTPKGGKCGGSPEGTALTVQCAEGLYCEYHKPYYAKCVQSEDAAVDFATEPPTECADIGTQCMGTPEFVLGLGVDGNGNQRLGVCCKEGLRCVFMEPYLGVCDEASKYALCDDEDCGDGAVTDPSTATVMSEPMPDTRPRTIDIYSKCGGSPTGTTADTCVDGLVCQYQSPVFAKCVKATAAPETFPSDPPHECGTVGTQCMGDQDFLTSLGEGRTGRCCEKGLSCIFQAPYLGLCADPLHYESAASFPK